MANRCLLYIASACLLACGIFAAEAGAQTFQIQELPVLHGNLGPSDNSLGKFLNAKGNVLGTRTVQYETGLHTFLWDQTHAFDVMSAGNAGIGLGLNGLNDLDQVIGLNSEIEGFGFFWNAQNKQMVRLGTLGGDSSSPTDVNNLGQVVGSSTIQPGNFRSFPFLWTAQGGMQNLGGLSPGAVSGSATHVNELGQVAGTSQLEDFSTRGFFWSPATGMVDIGPAIRIGGMNDLSQIVGITNDGVPFRASVTISPEGEPSVHREDLPTNGLSGNEASGINNAGQAVGIIGVIRTVIWETDGSLNVIHANTAAGQVINDSGHVATMVPTGGFGLRGLFWSPGGGAVELDSLGGVRTQISAINDFDEITGFSQNADGGFRAVVWTRTDAGPTIPPEIASLIESIGALADAGLLQNGLAASLQARLVAAANQIEQGSTTGAVHLLTAQILQVDSLASAGVIASDAAEFIASGLADVLAALPE